MEVEGTWRLLMGDELADVGTTISLQGGVARRIDDHWDVSGSYEDRGEELAISFEWSDDRGRYKETFVVSAMDADTLSGVLNAETDLDGDDPFDFSDPIILRRVDLA